LLSREELFFSLVVKLLGQGSGLGFLFGFFLLLLFILECFLFGLFLCIFGFLG
jgi:hypothetical protein